MKEAELLAALKDNDREDRALEYVYSKYHPIVCKSIMKLGGTQEDAEDVFQESIILLYENVRSGKFREKSSLKTYLAAIAKFRWMKKLRKTSPSMQYVGNSNESFEDDPDFWIAEAEQEKLVTRLLQNMGETCLKVLTGFYYKGLSMRAIAKELGFKNEQVARNKKSKCLRTLKESWRKHEHKESIND